MLQVLARCVHRSPSRREAFVTYEKSSFPPVHPGEDTQAPSIHTRREADERWESVHRRHRFLTAVCMLLAAIGGLIWYEYPLLRAGRAYLIKLPHLSENVAAVASGLRQTDTRIADWSKQQNIDRQALQAQIAALTRDLRTRVEAARKQASDAADTAYRRVEIQIGQQIDSVKTRLERLESERKADHQQIAALRDELAQVRQDVSQQNDEISAVGRQLDQNSATTQTQLANLQQGQVQEGHNVDAIEDRLALQKIPFEAEKGHSRELAGGISLHVTGTDIAHQRVDGWMWLMPDRRTIWLHHQSVQEPVVLYGLSDGGRRELVITNVTRHSITGYLLLSMGLQAQAASAPVRAPAVTELP
jgi:hypothetical protein